MANKPYILLVDDDRDFLELMNDKLRASGFSIGMASDGNEAINSIKNKRPDLVLMDVQMPNKDGVKTTEELHNNKETKDLKIIFLTNLGESGPAIADVNKHFAQQIGARDYFKKGSDLDLLVDKIRETLGA